MKKDIVMVSVAIMMCAAAHAEADADYLTNAEVDSLKMCELQEVNVVSTRASKNTPIAFSTVNKEELKSLNHGKDLPQLLSLTPSVTVTSDAGNGIGYTSINVRGNDGTRVNVTANGIPINDAESSSVIWVNMPDLASSAEDIQVQRGAGTSTNGAGAFGATINIQTEKIGINPFVGIDLSAGSYYSHKETLRFGTGLLGGHWGIQGRLSDIGSKGYVDRAATKLDSYFIQGGYFDDYMSVKFITFNGQEETYHAWNYASQYEQELFGRTFNSCGAMNYTDKDGNVHDISLVYNPESVAQAIAEGGHINYYKDQKDFYHQQHYQLLFNRMMNDNLTLNVGLHYTRGDGYYEQYNARKELNMYGLAPSAKVTDLVNHKKMGNDFFGGIASLCYNNKKVFEAIIGGGWNRYIGDHFGYITWIKDIELIDRYSPFMEYYNNTSVKNDGNIYGKVNWEFVKGVSVFIDLQYRHTGITMNGPTDAFSFDEVEKTLYQTVFKELHQYDFFNPKFGLTYNIAGGHATYASVALTHKEPTRNDFEHNVDKKLNAEKLIDYELGYRFSSRRLAAGVNLYYMNYTNQFVLTGKLNDIGEPIKANSGKSYRMGVELEGAWAPVDWFRWDANMSLSRNRNKNWTVTPRYLDYKPSKDAYGVKIKSLNLGSTPISFTPNFTFNNVLTFSYKGIKAAVMSQYIGERYLTNTGFKTFCVNGGDKEVSMMLDGFFKTDIDLSYTTKALSKHGLKEAVIGVTLYNVFNKKYNNNGWSYCEIDIVDGKPYAWSDSPCETGLAVSAPFNFMANLSLNF